MQENKLAQGFTEIYRDLAELIGIEKTLIIYENMKGQQITLPKRLYAVDYVKKELSSRGTEKNIKELAKEFNYTERYMRKLLNVLEQEKL